MRFIEGDERSQSVLFPEQLEDWIAQDNPVRVVDVFIDELDLKRLCVEGVMAAETGRPGLTLQRHPLVSRMLGSARCSGSRLAEFVTL